MSFTTYFFDVASGICNHLSFTNPSFVGAGVFKEVYSTQTTEHTPVALKVFSPSRCNLCRAEREIESMKKCNSSVIGKLYDWGSHIHTNGSAYLYTIEEFFDGGTLTNKMGGAIEPVRVCDYGIALMRAVAHLREHALVHRDIKPDNIMFRDGEDTPTLVDFGLVRDLMDVSLTMSYLQQGPGTPFFASPEQLNNEKHLIDWRSDQFSVGIVLGLCLTESHPYQTPGDSKVSTIDRVIGKQTPSVRFRERAEALGCRFLIKMVAPWSVERFDHPNEIVQVIERTKKEI